MKHFCDQWIEEWCQDNGWTDLVISGYNQYWAFPPNAVMPEPIPSKVLRLIKAEKGLCFEEKVWISLVSLASVSAIILCYFLRSPMPLVFTFAFNAIAVAKLEVEDM
ncbi:conserved hypothetical protein [Gloeothece citriformis PCC 7424]|uniref:Uncharacterized protein n=1 Tax=Gloeothece citriformis (strain PCC 7424) TaxID=65393 RepID=B7KBT2_GLOC7|nr:hypothetical protein [Gloeothece citriformis]ACK73060.1 conserved hypothetical protein [Gloeothece citriformis PCC 7424]